MKTRVDPARAALVLVGIALTQMLIWHAAGALVETSSIAGRALSVSLGLASAGLLASLSCRCATFCLGRYAQAWNQMKYGSGAHTNRRLFA